MSEVRDTGDEDRTGGEIFGSKGLIDSVIYEVVDCAVGLGVRSRVSLVLKVHGFPFSTGEGISIDGVGTGLSEFNEFAVGNTGRRPGFRDVAGVKYVLTRAAARTRGTKDEVLAVMARFFESVDTPAPIDDSFGEINITRTTGTRRDTTRSGSPGGLCNRGSKATDNGRFELTRHNL